MNLTEDDIRDIAIAIVDELVGEGLIPNCMDTNNGKEFAFQDVIVEVLTDSQLVVENK